MVQVAHLAVLFLVALAFNGCGRIYPVTTGFHAPVDPNFFCQHCTQNVKRRVVVWSNHPGVANAIAGWLQEGGHTVVERARLQEVFNEQRIRLSHTPDDDADILRVGRLIGAERVVFAEVTVKSEKVSQAYYHPYGGWGSSGTVYHASVAVRSVNVENGEIRWSGTASYPQAITNPEEAVIYLANAAIGRDRCRIESDYEWSDVEGCTKK